MGKKHKKVCTTLNYIDQFLILAFVVTGCVSIYVSIGIMSSAIA